MPHQCTDCGRTFEDGSKEMLSGCPDCGGNKFQFIPADAVGESVEANSPGEPPSRDSSAGAVSKAATTVRDWVGGADDEPDREPDDRSPGEWPKSATEDYDTPAEKAATRADDDDAVAAESPTGSGSATGASASAGPSADPDESGSASQPEPTRDDGTIQAGTAADEDTAQASARTDVVSPDELPDGTATPPETPADESRSDQPTAAGPESRQAGAESPATGSEAAAPDRQGAEERHEVADPAETQVEDRPDLDELREELNQQFESIKILNPGQYELNLMELYDREEYIISLREDGRYVIDVPDSWRGDD